MNENSCIVLAIVYCFITFPLTVLCTGRLEREILRNGFCISFGLLHIFDQSIIIGFIQLSILAAANLYIQWRIKPTIPQSLSDAFSFPSSAGPSGLDMSKEFGP